MFKLKKMILTFSLIVAVLMSSFAGVSVNAVVPEKIEAGKSRVLMEYGTGQILSEYNKLEHLPIASVTKLMTLLLAFEALDSGKLSLEQELIASENAAGMGGSQVFIDANSSYKVENLLHAIIISSANDACVMIAEELAGSEADFVVLMNQKIKSLGGNDTNYGNCTGLPCANAYSCANDVALVMREVIQHPKYFEISKIWMEDFQHPSGRVTEMANTNKLLRSYTGCDAGKTGSTNEAGFCMSATAKKGNMRLIAVVLGADNSKSRFGTCATLFDWGFANYSSECLLDKNQDLDIEYNVKLAKNTSPVRASESYYALTKKGEKSNLNIEYEMFNLNAPLAKGSIIGKAIITDNGVVVAEINIETIQDIEVMNYSDRIKSIVKEWNLFAN